MRSLVTLTILLSAVAPARAQTDQAPSPGPPAGVTCLNGSLVDATGASQPLAIYVPADEAGSYAGKGFAAGACGSMSLTAYRAETCRIARLGNDAVQARLEQVLGAKPRDLCDSVKRATPYPTAVGN